jgi:hypothetical protein
MDRKELKDELLPAAFRDATTHPLQTTLLLLSFVPISVVNYDGILINHLLLRRLSHLWFRLVQWP